MKRLLIFFVLACSIQINTAFAVCEGTVLNPITDVCWSCMFPARIGGVAFGGGGSDYAPGGVTSPACACPTSTGFMVGVASAFWEHSRLVETVKDPYCFTTLGTGLTNPKPGFLSGEAKASENGDGDLSFQQAHYYMFPVWTIMKLFMDFPCADKGNFDVAYMTEVDPMWNDDSLSFMINPEALLFGNPISQIACAADTVGATVGYPVDPLFWCQGSWGSFYPLSGSMAENNPLNTNAGLAARMLFKLGREAIMYDTAINKCSQTGVITPILVKSHYRFQIARPVKGNSCIPIGQPSMIWGAGKNPPSGAGVNSADNFLWVMTRARVCCVGYNVSGGSLM